MVKQILSFRELVDQLAPIVVKFKGKFDTAGNSNEDIRGMIFLNLKMEIENTLVSLNPLLCVDEGIIKPEDFQTYFGLTDPTKIDILLDNQNNFCRLNLVTIVQFQIENFFKNILKELKPDISVDKRYYRNLSDLFNELFDDVKQDEQDLLMVFQHARNSLHANGIHNNNNFVKTIEGINFEFIKGKKLDGVGWEVIIIILNRMADILEEIVKTKKVKSITGPISYQFIDN